MPSLRRSVTIYPAGGDGEYAEPIRFVAHTFDYLSFINSETYGIPPLVTKTRDNGGERPPVAADNERVLYVNPGAVLAIELGPVED